MQEKHLELYQQAVEGCDSRLRLKMCSLAAMNGVEDFHSFILLSSSGKGHLSAWAAVSGCNTLCS